MIKEKNMFKKVIVSIGAITFLSGSLFGAELGGGSLRDSLSGRLQQTVSRTAGLETGLGWMGAGADVCAITGGGMLGLSAANRLGLSSPWKATFGITGAVSGFAASQGAQWYTCQLGRAVTDIARDQRAIAVHTDERLDLLERNQQRLASDGLKTREELHARMDRVDDALNIAANERATPAAAQMERGTALQLGAPGIRSRLHTYGPGFLVGASFTAAAALILYKTSNS